MFNAGSFGYALVTRSFRIAWVVEAALVSDVEVAEGGVTVGSTVAGGVDDAVGATGGVDVASVVEAVGLKG